MSLLRPLQQWYYAPMSSNQRHNMTINYTYDLPHRAWANPILKGALDGWQRSGENAWVSGDWADISLSTTDSFDFTGGSEGARPVLVADPKLARADRDPLTHWFNTGAFARPSGRGDFGNEPRTVIQLPGINNWNLALFKNFALGKRRVIQYRAEAYNVLNKLQFKDIDRTARFDVAGAQVNANFGKATSARNPRIMQMSIRFTF